jgi:hypothetical protein
MIRTKHLVVGVFALALFVSAYGLSAFQEHAGVPLSADEVTFGTPKDAYGVIVENRNDRALRRSEFIASVRSALLKDLSEGKEVKVRAPEVVEAPGEDEPVVLEVPVFNTGDNYGDTVSIGTTTAATSTIVPDSPFPEIVLPTPATQSTSTHE